VKDCIFCKIISGEIPAEKIAENDSLIVIKDITPKAPVHFLIIPKKHIKDLVSLEKADAALLGEVGLMAKELSKKLSGSQAFQLVTNCGADAGQSVFHLHFHFLSGKKIADL